MQVCPCNRIEVSGNCYKLRKVGAFCGNQSCYGAPTGIPNQNNRAGTALLLDEVDRLIGCRDDFRRKAVACPPFIVTADLIFCASVLTGTCEIDSLFAVLEGKVKRQRIFRCRIF